MVGTEAQGWRLGEDLAESRADLAPTGLDAELARDRGVTFAHRPASVEQSPSGVEENHLEHLQLLSLGAAQDEAAGQRPQTAYDEPAPMPDLARVNLDRLLRQRHRRHLKGTPGGRPAGRRQLPPRYIRHP